MYLLGLRLTIAYRIHIHKDVLKVALTVHKISGILRIIVVE